MKNKKLIIILFIWIFFILSLIPLLNYAKFTNPSADDFTYSANSKLAYNETGKIGNTINAAINSTKKAYHSWQGTFFGTFLMAISPNVFSIKLYKAAPVLLIVIFTLSTIFFTYTIIKYLFRSKAIYSLIISPIIVFLSLQFIPSLVEGIYWYNGAWYYTFSYCLTLLLFSFIIIFTSIESRTKTIILYIFSLILAFLLGGVNFTISFFSLIMISFITLIMFIYKRNNKYMLLILSIVIFSGVLISYLAPGNDVRANILNINVQVVDAIFLSLKANILFNFNWIKYNFLFVFIILLMPIFKDIINDINFEFKKPGIFLLTTFLIFSTQFTPPIFSLGSYGPYRLINVIYYSSIWFILSNAVYFYGYYLKTKKPRQKSKILNAKKKSSKPYYYIILIIVITF